jgi:hypothetical protein
MKKREQDSIERDANVKNTSVKLIGLYHRETRTFVVQGKYYPLEQAAKAQQLEKQSALLQP